MGELQLRCVKVSGQHEVQDVLNQAFKVFVDQQFGPVWFSQDDCLKVTKKERNTIYIFDLFEGEAFDHIAGLGCRILGPMSILTSVALNKNIPRTTTPLYNMAMKDVVVCCTNLERETREKVFKLVEWMGGATMKDFTEDVTHLVAGVVGSRKYQVAAEMGKQLMLPKWVEVVWEKSRFEAVHGMDEQFQEFKCGVFSGCVVTVSGLGASERQEVKKLVEREGGEYSGEMRVKETTHLIINEPKGQKYQFALKWSLKIIRSEWLYESIEKGYCQDEDSYGVKSRSHDQPTQSGMKTSTPERKSMAGGINDLSNISAISMVAVEESRMGNLTTLTSTRLEEPDPLDALDMSKMPMEMFLDGCKIFLSGFRGATLDKLRKIINIGHGTRCNQINDNVTHVVIGDRINTDIEHIKTLGTRPHTVTINWLVECYKQEQHVEEMSYYSSELPAPETSSSPQLKKPTRKSRAPKPTVAELPPPPPTTTAMREGANEDDMHEIMSQYMNTDTTKAGDETMAPQNGMDVDDDMTQDPDATTGTQVEGGVFSGRTFMLFGFEEEHLPVLTSFIKENGGKVLQLNVRGIPDYAIVPIDGFPVDKTVNSIVTNVWLQMCIEQNQLLPERSNALFMPLEIQVDKLPLKDCVISISGYTGVERDCLMRIADILGARTQEYFVRKAKEGLLPSTHLVVNAPEGSKYGAAVKWNIPAVTKSWILACARTGNREKEDEYLTVNGDQNESRLVEQSEKTVEAKNQKNQSNILTVQSKHSLQNEDQSNTVAQRENENNRTNVSNKSDQNDRTMKTNSTATTDGYQEFSTMGDTEALMCEITAGGNPKGNSMAISDNYDKGRDAVSLTTTTTDNNEFSEMGDTAAMMQELSNVEHGENDTNINQSAKDTSNSKTVTNIDKVSANVQQVEAMDTGSPTVTFKQRQSLGRKQVLEKQSASQKENVSSSGRSTPVQNRVRELQQTDQPSNQSEKVTPSKFLNPNKKFHPNFNVEELLAEIHTPEDVRAKKAKRRDSLPLEELFSLKLEEARQKIAKESELKRQQKDQERVLSQLDESEGDADMDASSVILCGVVISVSKKLAKDQSDLNDLVSSLGGDYRWSYDNSCTHFIFQGRANDTSKEFRMARNQKNLKIVSPHWLYKCKEQNERVDESLYPHTYNPNLSLSVVSSKRTPLRTPVRSTRRLRDRAGSNKDVVNIDTVEEPNQASGRLGHQDKAEDSKQTGAKGENNKIGTVTGQRELRSSDKSGSDEEKRVPDQHCETGSLEMREVLSKQLENVMAEPLDRKRRKSKRLNNSGQVGTPEDTARQTRRTQDDSKNISGRTSRGASGKEEKLPGEMSQSQSVQVVWADPVGRLEQEKLAEKLERACSPTQDVDSGDHVGLEIPQDAQFSDTDPEPEPEDHPPFSNQVTDVSKTTPKLSKQNSHRTPTPEGPPLAFPTMKSKKITPPRPVELIEEQPPAHPREPPVFILSGMQQAEKDDYGALVEQLGGKILEATQFDCSCTHLVISSVTRNEKFLASIASGKWVLHKSYFEACRQEQRFVEEDVYEWGSEGTLSLVKNMESNVRLLAAAARQWRIQIQEQKKRSSDKFGAFCEWNVILCCDKNKESSYKRLLEAGGATVTSQRPPFTSGVAATHVLMEPHKVPLSQEDFEALLSSGCLCLRPDFISAHLSDPESDVHDYYPAEIVALKAVLSDTPKKRKASSGQTVSKRSRRR